MDIVHFGQPRSGNHLFINWLKLFPGEWHFTNNILPDDKYYRSSKCLEPILARMKSPHLYNIYSIEHTHRLLGTTISTLVSGRRQTYIIRHPLNWLASMLFKEENPDEEYGHRMRNFGRGIGLHMLSGGMLKYK